MGDERSVVVLCAGIWFRNHQNPPMPCTLRETMIRAVLGHTAMMSWGITLTDIKTVFLHALRPPPPKGTEEVIVVPPKIFVQAGICSPDERWRVRRALYGFQTSPALWAGHRDGTMKGFKRTHLEIIYGYANPRREPLEDLGS